jgi:hypothetical protein
MKIVYKISWHGKTCFVSINADFLYGEDNNPITGRSYMYHLPPKRYEKFYYFNK